MNKAIHYLLLIYENKFSVLSVCITFCAVTVVFLFGYSSDKSFNDCIDTSKRIGLDNAVKVENIDSDSVIDEIDALNIVDKVIAVRKNLSFGEDGFYIPTLNYSWGEDNEIAPIRMEDDSFCTKLGPNEVLLCSSLKGRYREGDVVSFEIRWQNSADVYLYCNNVPFKIVGFVDNDQIVVGGGRYRWPQDLSSYYQNYDEFMIYSSFDQSNLDIFRYEYVEDEAGYDVQYAEVDKDRVDLEPALWYLIVCPMEGKSLEVSEEINRLIPNARLYDYNVLRDNYVENESYEYYMIRSLLFVSCVTSVIVVLSSLIMCLFKRRRDIVLFHLMGATWKYSLFSVLSTHFIGVLSGMLIGMSIGRYITLSIYGEKYAADVDVFAIYGVVVLVIYMLLLIPFYISLSNKTPIELYRMQEQ